MQRTTIAHTHTEKHHSPRHLSSRIVWMNSSAVDAMTGGVWSAPEAHLGSGTLSLSFPFTKGEWDWYYITRTHMYAPHTHECKQANCNAHLQSPLILLMLRTYVHTVIIAHESLRNNNASARQTIQLHSRQPIFS